MKRRSHGVRPRSRSLPSMTGATTASCSSALWNASLWACATSILFPWPRVQVGPVQTCRRTEAPSCQGSKSAAAGLSSSPMDTDEVIVLGLVLRSADPESVTCRVIAGVARLSASQSRGRVLSQEGRRSRLELLLAGNEGGPVDRLIQLTAAGALRHVQAYPRRKVLTRELSRMPFSSSMTYSEPFRASNPSNPSAMYWRAQQEVSWLCKTFGRNLPLGSQR